MPDQPRNLVQQMIQDHLAAGEPAAGREVTPREQAILLAGGRLAHTRAAGAA